MGRTSCSTNSEALPSHDAFVHLRDRPPAPSDHLQAINVDLIPIDMAGHGNVMSLVTFKSIGIIHRQYLLVFVGNNNWAGTLFDALLRACGMVRASPLDATLGIANPAVNGLGIARK
jgi:hypothetical protein